MLDVYECEESVCCVYVVDCGSSQHYIIYVCIWLLLWYWISVTLFARLGEVIIIFFFNSMIRVAVLFDGSKSLVIRLSHPYILNAIEIVILLYTDKYTENAPMLYLVLTSIKEKRPT